MVTIKHRLKKHTMNTKKHMMKCIRAEMTNLFLWWISRFLVWRNFVQKVNWKTWKCRMRLMPARLLYRLKSIMEMVRKQKSGLYSLRMKHITTQQKLSRLVELLPVLAVQFVIRCQDVAMFIRQCAWQVRLTRQNLRKRRWKESFPSVRLWQELPKVTAHMVTRLVWQPDLWMKYIIQIMLQNVWRLVPLWVLLQEKM